MGLIDNAIDIKQLIPQDKQDGNRLFHIEGDIEQFVLGNYYKQKGNNIKMSNINQSHSGSGDNIGGDKNVTNDQSRSINISGGTINASGAGALSQGDKHGTIANNLKKSNSQPQQESKITNILAIAAAIATIIALFFNGIFNTEVREWFDDLFNQDIPKTSHPKQNKVAE